MGSASWLIGIRSVVSLFAITGLPILLTGAALVGLPVLLHLIMKQEPKRLPFPAFRFLKQRRQINQRKIRLRHLLLLLLRMGLIALICLSLWQPTTLSEGFSLRGGRPIAVVVVVDSSPSMGYVLAADRSGLTEARQRRLKLLEEPAEGAWTCLDEARGCALEMLEDLPSGSRIVVLDTADRGEPIWSADLSAARQRIRDIKKPRANSQPVTRVLEAAYSVLSRADTELEPGQEPFPRLLAVFSDRTVVSWDVNRAAELQSARDRVPPPNIYHVYVDVGVDKPVNTAITAIDFKPQLIPANQPVVIAVTVESTTSSPDGNILWFSVDGDEPQRRPVTPGVDRPITVQFRKEGLKPGLHHAKLALVTSDALPFDNEKFVTFRVREPRRVLALVDMPSGSFLSRVTRNLGLSVGPAKVWKEALDAKGWYACDVRPATESESIDFNLYEEITLLDVAKPTTGLWEKLSAYLDRGGNVIVTPPLPAIADVAAYQTTAAMAVLPQKFIGWTEALPNESREIPWLWRALNANRPLLSKFRESLDQSDWLRVGEGHPTTSGFWKVEKDARERVVATYDDGPEADQSSPAVLEWGAGRGRVIQLTVPMGLGSNDRIHNYASTWFYLVLVNEAIRTLVGDSEDQSFNFTAGQGVVVKLPPEGKPGAIYYLSGPDVSATDALIRREEGQPYFRFGPEKTGTAGNFTVQSEDGKWSDGFSINAPVEESNLDRLPPEAIAELFGADALAAADKKRDLAEILSGRFTQPIELFPFLMILLLLVLAGENLLANKFYRRKRAVA
jgi:Aerotolerance regulator N-terminal